MTDLALHHLTILDTDPLRFVDIAAETGCTGVCVFAHFPEIIGDGAGMPMVTKSMLPELQRRLSDNNLRVGKIDFFAVTDKMPRDGFRDAFEIGAKLGARHATTLIYDPVPARAAENLANMAATAAEYGLRIGVEFMTISPGCATLEQAVALIRAAGRDNIGICVDALHLERSGGKPADVAATDPKLIGSAQLCDGPLGFSNDYVAESLDRLVAGEGQFPLAALIAALPAWTDYDVETPMPKLQAQGVPPLERAKKAVSGARAVLAAVNPGP